MHHEKLNLIIPVGTQIVTRSAITDARGETLCPPGAVGVIVTAPLDGSPAYRVSFPNGREAALHRHELTIRKQHQQGALAHLESPLAEAGLYDHVIYRCIVGSRAYGLDHAASDTDRRGIQVHQQK